MSNAESCLGIGMGQALVGSVHGWRNAFGLANLVAAQESTIEDLYDEDGKVVGIDSGQGISFDSVPTSFGNLGWGISSRVRGEAPICLSTIFSEKREGKRRPKVRT